MTTQRAQVAESSFNFLHMELVQMALGELPEGATSHSTSQLQQASRKVEAIGFQVGVRLVERYTKDRPRFSDTLEIIKFLCKDFWMEVYRKQIDKLQTNNRVRFKRQRPGPFNHISLYFTALSLTHVCQLCAVLLPSQGVYMLQDNSHPVLARCSPSAERQSQAKQLAAVHIKFPSGLIRGALSGLGVIASVSAEVGDMPKCQLCAPLPPP